MDWMPAFAEVPPVAVAARPAAVPARPILLMAAFARDVLRVAWLPRLAREPGIVLVGARVDDATHLVAGIAGTRPEILLLDRRMLEALGPASLQALQSQPGLRVLLVGDESGTAPVADVVRHRFHGYLGTGASPELSLKAIRAVSRGELWLSRACLARALAELAGQATPGPTACDVAVARGLTPRERQVVELLRSGCTNKEIAQRLGIMEDTVKKHLQGVFAKLGVHRRTLVAMRGLASSTA